MNAGRLVFLGSKESGFKALHALLAHLPPGTIKAVICPNDAADERSFLERFRTLAAANGIPFHLSLRKDDAIALIEQYDAQVAMVHGWYQMLAVERIPDVLCLGFHYSPLPEFRGNAPLVWQIIEGRSEVGVSFFRLTPGMDDGDLVDQRNVPLGADETIGDALRKIDLVVDEMIKQFASVWPQGEVQLRPQPDRPPSYCGLRVPEDGRIDWRWDASAIHDFVRAQARPYPGAFTMLPDGTKLTIWASHLETRTFFGVPGAVASIEAAAVVVSAGKGALRLTRVQREGESDVPASEVLTSLRLRLS
jgi:methionyl-tRNA formyltransferase